MASEPNDLDQYVAYVRAELNKGKYTAFEFMSRERLREILDALTEARAALAVQARTHVVETPVLVQASRRTAYQPQGTPGAPAVTDEELTQLAERMARGYTMSMYATQGDMLPIESAPKDDTDILVGGWYEPEDGSAPAWVNRISSYLDKGWRRGFRHRNGAYWATHWMPLPAPPSLPGEPRQQPASLAAEKTGET